MSIFTRALVTLDGRSFKPINKYARYDIIRREFFYHCECLLVVREKYFFDKEGFNFACSFVCLRPSTGLLIVSVSENSMKDQDGFHAFFCVSPYSNVQLFGFEVLICLLFEGLKEEVLMAWGDHKITERKKD